LEVLGPEYATPECGNPLELIVHDKAGERILEGLFADDVQRLRDEGSADDVRIFKRSAGPADRPSGCQEDYLVGRGGRFGRLADI
jgi:proteasome accessory factor A